MKAIVEQSSTLSRLNLVGGRLCLDFANTVGWRQGEARYDHLLGYGDLVRWSERAGAVSAAEAAELQHASQADEQAAAGVFRRALELREAIYAMFSAVADGQAVPGEPLATLNARLSEAMAQARLRPANGSFAWDWRGAIALDRVLWPVARSAAELLTSDELGRVGECAGPGCGWLYLDTSKNWSRRWCDMRDCGNRAKVRRHYRRTRHETDGHSS